VRQEGLGEIKSPMTSSGFLPACSAVSQPTPPLRAPEVLSRHLLGLNEENQNDLSQDSRCPDLD
jgi:hypothetical protein